MRTNLGVCVAAILALEVGAAAAQPAPIPQPADPPATQAQIRAGWPLIGSGSLPLYAGPVARSKRTPTQVLAWSATLFPQPVAANGRNLHGTVYLREFDCAKGASRVLYSAIIGDTEVVRWDRTEPSAWTPFTEVRAESFLTYIRRICPAA